MKKSYFILFISIFLTANLMAQPQYYTSNTGTSSNSFPFNMSGGKAVNSLILAGEFINPTPLPPGQKITRVYFRTNTAGTRTYTNLHICLAQDVITTLTSGVFYAGTYDTVFAKDTSLTSTVGGWMAVTLSHAFNYDPTKSLIVFVGQCGYTGTGASIFNSSASGIRRVWSVGGCPFVPYASGDGSLMNFGVDVVPAAPPICNYYSSQWCAINAFPNLPAATYFQASAWLGDTLYVQAPPAGVGVTTVFRYTYGGTWSTGVPLPVGKVGGTLTACNGKLYYIGGGTASITTGTTDVYEYTPSTGTWVTKAPLPAALSAHGAVNWGDSVIFVWGGPYTGAGTNLAVHYYRVGSNTWGTIASSLPSGQGRRTFSSGIVGNKLIMSCGYNTAFLKSTYVGTIGSDASQITWVSAPDCPTTESGLSRPGGASYGLYHYMICGEQGTSTGYHNRAYVFAPATNTWVTQIFPKPTAMSNIFAGCVAKCINDTVRVFVPGGYNGVAVANFEVIGCGPTIVGNSTIISNVPNAYSLSQNYPNPFNPTTKIAFSLPKNSDVKLVVYDILGKEVATLVNDYRTAGTHSVEFNASNLASGVYLYRIEAGDFKETKRMMLVK